MRLIFGDIKKIRIIYLAVIIFVIAFCYSLIFVFNEKSKTKVITKEINKEQLVKTDNLDLNKEGYNEKKYTLISKFPLDGIVTSTIFSKGNNTKFPYSLFYYNEIKKGWYVYDVKDKREIFIATESNKPISVVYNYDKFQVIYTVFEGGKWLVKDLDIGEGKIIWNYSLGDVPTLDLNISNGILLVKISSWYDSNNLVDGSEGCNFGYDLEKLSAKDKISIQQCEIGVQKRAEEITEDLKFAQNALLALDISNGKLLWKFSSRNDVVPVLEMFNFDVYSRKSIVVIYPISDLDYKGYSGLKIINKVYILDLNTGKQLYSVNWPISGENYSGNGTNIDFIRFLSISDDNDLEIWSVNDNHDYFSWHLIPLKDGKELFRNEYRLDTLGHGILGWIGEDKSNNTFFEIKISEKHQATIRQINKEEADKNYLHYNSYEDYGRGLVSSDYKFVGYVREYNDKTNSYPSAQAYVNFKDGFMYIFKD